MSVRIDARCARLFPRYLAIAGACLWITLATPPLAADGNAVRRLHKTVYAELANPDASGRADASGASAIPPASSSRRNPTMTVPYTSTPPVIDGALDEDTWALGALAQDFWVVAEERAPSARTVVRVLRDAEYLYFAFVCFDDQPSRILSDLTRRDGGLANDDRVFVELDTYLNYRTLSTYAVNPRGTQNDSFAGGRATKIEWKGDWKAGARLTEFGWTAEMAIPFSILNYQTEAREFGINLGRYHSRTDETSYWADVTPQFRNEYMGRIDGLALPDRPNDNPWTVMPYLLASANAPDIKGKPRDRQGYAGAEIRYQPSPNVTGVASIYPDFSTLETQVTDIDFSYTEKSMLDPRPFFQEGAAYFGDDIAYFYSNRVADFYGGVKAFAQFGNTGAGGFATYGLDDRFDGVARTQHDFDATHSADLMAVVSHRQSFNNQLVVARASGHQQSGWHYAADLALSNTSDMDFEQGGAGNIDLGWQSDFWNFGVSVDYFDVEYFPANGLLKADRYGTRSVTGYGTYYRRMDAGLRELSGNLIYEDRVTVAGDKQSQGIYADMAVETDSQIRLLVAYYQGDYRPAIGRGHFSNQVNDDHYWVASLDFNTRSGTHGYGVYYSDGELGGGDYQYVTGYLWMRPFQPLLLNLSTERLDNFDVYRQTIVSATWDVTPEDSLVARYIFAEGDDYRRLAYRRTVRRGMDLFLVYNEDPFSETEFAVKLLWTIR